MGEVISLAAVCKRRANRAFTRAFELMNRANSFTDRGLDSHANALVDKVDEVSTMAEKYQYLSERFSREA